MPRPALDTKHAAAVRTIAAQVGAFYTRKQPFHIFHGSTNSTRILSFKRSEMLDISQLNRVLSVDVKKRTAIVEPNVPMDALVAATLQHGLIPPVVMEFPGITVGGGIQGGAGESSSFKWGCFNQTCNWYEMVLADGRVVTATRSAGKYSDLFYGTAGSYGTFGVITAAEVQLIPARPYVTLQYLPVDSFAAATKLIEQSVAKDYDFIDGIMFAPDSGLIIVGTLADSATGRVQRFSRARDPWFYLHAEKINQMGSKHQGEQIITESVPLVDYLFRYDRGAFWVGRFAFELFEVPFNAFSRWLLNPLLHTRKLYQALQDSGASQEHVVQDLALPKDQAVKFMQFVDSSLHIYPLWLCPLKPDDKSPLQSNNLDTPLVINVGVWGSRIESYDEFLAANRLIETKLRALGGKKWFYAHSYYTSQEFWSLYDQIAYQKLRQKYHADTLPDIYDKIRVKKRYPVNAKRAVYRTIFGRTRLRIED